MAPAVIDKGFAAALAGVIKGRRPGYDPGSRGWRSDNWPFWATEAEAAGVLSPPGPEERAMTTMPQAAGFLASLDGLPVRSFGPGELLLSAGAATGQVLVLKEGVVEVVKDGVALTQVSEPGAVFGEMAALLDQPHSADVRALEPSDLYVIEDGRGFFLREPAATLHVAVILARRLDAVNGYLVQARSGLEQAGRPTGLLDQIIADIGRAIRYGPMIP
jgi:hypothetical protein